ncbi:hypothetical protein C5F64_05885 [Photobacterium damselae subsp. damselae]|uniref:Mbeg1-like protein n=1 Tax=Photobacterium damselae TaxID=38293 RepID=UPI000D063C73|nr:Mbeg1-like protein [Photobacterium damselae]PSB89544.1 hypothetical protein C5F64_05885 [Photobacterium damselae subsp. damselae]
MVNKPILDCNSENDLENQELAKLSNGIYSSQPHRFSSELRNFCYGNDDDTDCEVIKHNHVRYLLATTEVTVVFPGTEDSDDFWTDLLQHFGYKLAAYKDAEEIALQIKGEYPDAHITFSGHSLGGALANFAAHVADSDAVIFNPAKLHIYNAVDPLLVNGSYNGNILTFVNENDPISGAKLRASPTNYQGDVFVLVENNNRPSEFRHKIKEVIARLDDVTRAPNVTRKLCQSYNGRDSSDL